MEHIQNSAPQERVLPIIVSYHPDQSLLQLVEDLRGQVTEILVIDNGSFPNKTLDALRENDSVTLLELGENIGLAAALNRGVQYATQRGFSHVLTLDQDTHLPGDYISRMMNFWASLIPTGQRVGVIAPNFFDINSRTNAKFSVVSRWYTKTVSCGCSAEALVTNFAITSGSIYPVLVLQSVGSFREDFFIDQIDTEYCLRLMRNGYKVFINCAVCINHAIGKRTLHKWLGLTIKPNHHSPLRRYYIARNGVFTASLYYRQYPSYLILTIMRLVHEAISILFFETNRIEKMSMLIKGCWSGLLGKLGPAR